MTPAGASLTLLVIAFIGTAAAAQTPEHDRPLGEWLNVAEDMFEQVMSPTQQQKEKLERVEISMAEEKQVGEEMYQEFLGQSGLSRFRIVSTDRHPDVRYLQALCQQIQPLMEQHERYSVINVHLAKSNTTDARSFPGGCVVVTTGMLEFAQSEAEVVGILAHELSHIDRGHQLERIRTMKLAEETYAEGNTDWREMAAGGALLAKHFGRPYRPDQEEEADRDAVQWMFELGYNPLEMAGLFARFSEQKEGDSAPLPQFVRSHPYFVDRQQAVSGLYRQLIAGHPDRALYVGRENLQRRVPRSQRVYAE
jgi:predicted Zn-dependent protease